MNEKSLGNKNKNNIMELKHTTSLNQIFKMCSMQFAICTQLDSDWDTRLLQQRYIVCVIPLSLDGATYLCTETFVCVRNLLMQLWPPQTELD